MKSTHKLLESSMASKTEELQPSGKTAANEELFVHLYDHLRRLGQHYLRHENPGHTLQATALVHEIYVKLLGDHEREWESRSHFLAVAALAMRQLLQNHARDRRALKRGGGWQKVTLGDAAAKPEEVDLVALSDALETLHQLNERHADVVSARLIAGLSVAETAVALGVSERTVKADWQVARAWLTNQLNDLE